MQADSHEWSVLKMRRIQHFGSIFDYTTRNVDLASSADVFPGPFREIALRIQSKLQEVNFPFFFFRRKN